MAERDIVWKATAHDMTGDETVEVWLKRGADPWELYESIPVDTSTPPDMEFEFLGLEEDVAHVAQLRVLREGRYRAGYLGDDPEQWPAQSRFEFVPGADALPAPAIVSAEFERTSAIAHQINVTVTPNAGALAYTLQLLRDGVVVDEVAGPHAGDVVLVDNDPPIATNVDYTARHIQFTLEGMETAPTTRWIGPDAPTALAQTGAHPDYYQYDVEWTNSGAGYPTRVRDDWPVAGFINRALVASPGNTHMQTLEKNSAKMEGADEQTTFCQVEVRHEATTFGVTDVSEWVGITVDALDETAH
jgi:hypothetical protein